MLRSAHIIVPALMSRLHRKENLNEMKLYALQRMQPSFHFRHADELVEVFEDYIHKALTPEGFLIRSTNPLMIMIQVTDILMHLKSQFRSLSLRITFVLD